MKSNLEPSRWDRFCGWVDRDFDHVRPISLLPLLLLPSLPLAIAFLIDAGESTVEVSRLFAISGIGVALLYYLYRQVLNLIRYLREGGG